MSTGGEPSSTGGESTGGAATGGESTESTGGESTESTGGEATGGASTGGASAGGEPPDTTGGASTGGVSPGGATAAGAPGAAGAAGSGAVEESLCVTQEGAEYPYDYAYGLISEYSYELGMSCDVGGYLLPLVEADPIYLAEVEAFVGVLSDWFHIEVLECPEFPGYTSEIDAAEFALVPVADDRVLSEADFEGIIAVFELVLSRHEALEDGFVGENRERLLQRLNAYVDSAVTDDGSELTHVIDPSTGMCIPSEF
jgi:hypothetical protein